MSTQELRVGIVGCGNISREHVKGYQRDGNVRIVKIFDVHRASAEKMAQAVGAEVAESLEEMAQPGELDAVSICTPPGSHLESCLPFLRAGIPILCEKPFEKNLDAALQLEEEIRNSSSLFMIAFCHRFNPYVREARRLLTEEADLLGRPIFFRNLFGGYLPVAGHRADANVSGGGVLIDNCSHSLDLFRFLMGEVDVVQAQVRNLDQQVAVEDFASIDVTGRGGFSGQIASSYSLPVAYNSIEIYCSKTTIVINYGVPDRPNLMLHIPTEVQARAVEVDESFDQFSGEISYFLDCVRTGATPTPGIDDAVASAHLIDAAYRSATEGRIIAVPAPDEVLA